MSLKSKVLLVILVLMIGISVRTLYMRSYVQKDFQIDTTDLFSSEFSL